MIKPGEIQKHANWVGVRDHQIEKDYILSWILLGIAHHATLSKILVLKGGTLLKKVYYKNYRYSEDLDFTLLDNAFSNQQIFDLFQMAFLEIKEEANIPLEISDNIVHEDGGINFFIRYIGPLGGIGQNKKVKVDISRSEKLVFEPVKKYAIVNYSDLKNYSLLCYPIEELLVEKLRCIMQRTQARDFYDIWYLVEIEKMDVGIYINEFRDKCRNKALDPENFHVKLEQKLLQYKARWQKSMNDQIKLLPDFEQVERELYRRIKNFRP